METANEYFDPQMNKTLGPFLIKDSPSKTFHFAKSGLTMHQQEN